MRTRVQPAAAIERCGIRLAALTVFVALCGVAVPGHASAQNLINNPNFSNGLLGYSGANASARTMDGATGAFFFGTQGFIQQFPIATVAGTEYVFTFLAAASNSDVSTAFSVFFDPTVENNNNTGIGSLVVPSLINSGLTEFTVSGTASSTSSFVSIQTNNAGGLFVTDFNLQPAPAPIPGGGILSFCAALVGFAIHRLRRKPAAI